MVTDEANKFVLRRTRQRLQGICKLMVEYNITLNALETFFLEEYETQEMEVARKRNKQNKKPIRQRQAQNAVKTRWDRYEALKDSHIVAKEAAKERVAAVKKPDLSFVDAKVTEPEEPEVKPARRSSRKVG